MDDLRRRIILAAQDLFLAEGIEAVSMRRVAETTGVTATAIYRHFRDKEALVDEIVGAGLAVLERYLQPALKGRDAPHRLRGLVDAYLRFAMEQPRYFDLAFLVPGPQAHISEELERHNRSTFRHAVEQVRLCMECGRLRPGDPVATAIHVWSTAHGLISLHRTNRLGLSPGEFRTLFRSTIDRTMEGLAPPPAAGLAGLKEKGGPKPPSEPGTAGARRRRAVSAS